eukprot:c53729_g1_i1.p1 GENE.c53729_g1_i1~~c53729_g1_i1.p1  ORF type:complete len:610 (+),score=161.95 c53729_g1_i1:43-1830(+)
MEDKVSNELLVVQARKESATRFDRMSRNQMTLHRMDFQRMLQGIRRTDLLHWLQQVFPERQLPSEDDHEGFMNLLKDGVLLCELANSISKRDQIHKFHKAPKYEAHMRENIQLFLSACKRIGLHDVQLFTADDIFGETGQADLEKRELRVSLTLLSLGLISNDIGKCATLVVNEVIRAEVEERRDMYNRLSSHPEALDENDDTAALVDDDDANQLTEVTAASLAHSTLTDLPLERASTTKRLTLRPKDNSVRFSLATVPRISTNLGSSSEFEDLHISGAGLSRLELDQLNALSMGNVDELIKGVGAGGPRSLGVRPVSMKLGTGQHGNMSTLESFCDENQNAITLRQLSPFVVNDCVQIGDEIVLVRGVLDKTLLVERGVNGTTPTTHEAGTTVLHVHSIKDELEVQNDMTEFAKLRQRALEENFEDLDTMNFIELLEDTSGNDDSNSSTFVYIVSEHYFKDHNQIDGKHNDDRLLAYLIQRLDNVVHNNYSILYFHSGKTEHQLEFSFLTKAYTVLSREYKHNLRNVWIVHPTVWVRMAYFFCAPFMDVGMTNKVAICHSLADLYNDFQEGGIPLPKVVLSTDEELSKSKWFAV